MILSYLLFVINIYGASCCGGSSVGLPLIVEHEKANFISRYVFSEVQDTVNADGLWSPAHGQDSYTTFKIEGSYALKYLQLNAGLDIVKTELGENSGSGIGDSYVGAAYQILDDTKNWYHPRLFHYAKITFPTGVSIYEANHPEEARGRGFWALATGLHLYKLSLPWDFTAQTEIYKGFKKSFQSEALGSYSAEPGFGGHLLIGAGYNYKKARLSTNLDWNAEEGIEVSSFGTAPSKRFVTWSTSASYMLEEHFDIVVSYFDQTLFGSPVNTELTRGVSVGLQKKWY